MLNVVNLTFRMVDKRNEYVYKDKEGEIHLRDWTLDGYDEYGEEKGYVYAGSDEFYADEDENDGEVEGFFGRWSKEDLEEILRIGLVYNDLAMVEDSLQTLYELGVTDEIHLAIRKGMMDICRFNGNLCFYNKFRLQLGYLLGLCGTTMGDHVMMQVANALIHLDQASAQLLIAKYINSGEIF